MRKTNTNTRRPSTNRGKRNTGKKDKNSIYESEEVEENAARLFKSLFSDIQCGEGKDKE